MRMRKRKLMLRSLALMPDFPECWDHERHAVYHYWEGKTTWEGDPTIPNGTRDISYFECRDCGEESDSTDRGELAEDYDPEDDRVQDRDPLDFTFMELAHAHN